MVEFWQALTDPDFPFLRYALLGGLVASVAFGVVGSYVVARRVSYLAGGISHSALGGIGAALFLQQVWGIEWFDPMLGAALVAVVSAIVIGLVGIYGSGREDTAIGAVWALGMAAGFVLMERLPVSVDATSYLFGNIVLVSKTDIWWVGALDVTVVIAAIAFYPKFLAVSFDEPYAEARGIHVRFYYLLLLVLTAVTVVLLVRLVGIIMAIALLTLPAATAGLFARRLWQMAVLAVLLCAALVVGGLAVAYPLNWPCGPVVVLLAVAAYAGAVLLKYVVKRAIP